MNINSDIKINSPIKNQIAHKGAMPTIQNENKETGASSLDALNAQGMAFVNLNKSEYVKNIDEFLEKYKREYEDAGFNKKDAEILARKRVNYLGIEIMEGYDKEAVKDYLDYREKVRKVKAEILHTGTGYSDKKAEKIARKKVKESDFYSDNLSQSVEDFETEIKVAGNIQSSLLGYSKPMVSYNTFMARKDKYGKRAASVTGYRLREKFLRELESIPNLLEYDRALAYHLKNTTLKEMAEILDVFSAFEGKYRVKADSDFQQRSPIMLARAEFKKEKNKITALKKAAANKIKGRKNPIDEILETGNISKLTPKFLEMLNGINTDDYIHDVKMLDCVFPMMSYIQKHPSSPISNHMYDRYYLPAIYCELKESLKSGDAAEMFIGQMDYINKHYGTKIFISRINDKKIYDAMGAFFHIIEEFQKWKEAANTSGETPKFPPTLDFYTSQPTYLADRTDLTASNLSTFGFLNHSTNNAISLRRMDYNMIIDLRHEMTHCNDTKFLDNLDEILNLNFTDDTPKNRKLQNFWANYFENTKDLPNEFFTTLPYYDEFEKAGFHESSILYAYSDPREFIAVASERDMSKYSPEFKQLLVDLGMPEWELNLKL